MPVWTLIYRIIFNHTCLQRHNNVSVVQPQTLLYEWAFMWMAKNIGHRMGLIYQKCLKKINVIVTHSNQSELSFYFINCSGEKKAILWLITMGDSPAHVCFNLLLNGWSGYIMWPRQPIRGFLGDWWCHNAPWAYKKACLAAGGNHFSLGFEKATCNEDHSDCLPYFFSHCPRTWETNARTR